MHFAYSTFVQNCIIGMAKISRHTALTACSSELSCQFYQQCGSRLLMLFFIHPLPRNSVINCMQNILTFTFMRTFDQNLVFFAERRHFDRQCECVTRIASKFVLFSVSSLKGEKFVKSKPTQKLKHTALF